MRATSGWIDKVIPRLRDVEIDDTVQDVVGVLFGLLLALVIAGIVTKQDDADSATAAQATAAAQLSRATRSFPIAEQVKFEHTIGQYLHAVVEDEWPAMRTGGHSVRAAAALESIYGTMQRSGEHAISVYRHALDQLDAITASRRTRLDLSVVRSADAHVAVGPRPGGVADDAVGRQGPPRRSVAVRPYRRMAWRLGPDENRGP